MAYSADRKWFRAWCVLPELVGPAWYTSRRFIVRALGYLRCELYMGGGMSVEKRRTRDVVSDPNCTGMRHRTRLSHVSRYTFAHHETTN